MPLRENLIHTPVSSPGGGWRSGSNGNQPIAKGLSSEETRLIKCLGQGLRQLV